MENEPEKQPEFGLVEKNKFHISKNVILIIVIIILIAVAIFLFFRLKHPTSQETITMQKFNSNDGSISIEALSNFEFSVQHIDGYELSIYSNKYSSSAFISKVSTANIRDIKKYIEADKTDYITKFSNIGDVSEITETTINNLRAYKYNFNYSSNMYVEVYIVHKGDYLYFIDFNINKDKEDLVKYLPDLVGSVTI